MKKITKLLMMVIAVLLVNVAMAQTSSTVKQANAKTKGTKSNGKPTVSQKAKVLADSLKNALSLTDEQYEKVYKINTDFITKKQELMKQAKSDSTSNTKTEIQDLRKNRNVEIKAVLTPEQIQKWQAWKKQKAKQIKENKDGGKMQNSIDDSDDF